MREQISADETVVIATFSNWNEAEIARGFLEDEGILSYVSGQEPHRAPELTEGVSLRVLASKSDRALELLADHDLLPEPSSPEDAEASEAAYRKLSFWLFVLIFALVLVGLLVYTP